MTEIVVSTSAPSLFPHSCGRSRACDRTRPRGTIQVDVRGAATTLRPAVRQIETQRMPQRPQTRLGQDRACGPCCIRTRCAADSAGAPSQVARDTDRKSGPKSSHFAALRTSSRSTYRARARRNRLPNGVLVQTGRSCKSERMSVMLLDLNLRTIYRTAQ